MKKRIGFIILFLLSTFQIFSQEQAWGFTYSSLIAFPVSQIPVDPVLLFPAQTSRTNIHTTTSHALGPDLHIRFAKDKPHGIRIGLHYMLTQSTYEINRFIFPVDPLSSFIPMEQLDQKLSLHYISMPFQFVHQGKSSHIRIGHSLGYFLGGSSRIEEEERTRIQLSGPNAFTFGVNCAIGFDIPLTESLRLSPELTSQLLFVSYGVNYFQLGLGLSLIKES